MGPPSISHSYYLEAVHGVDAMTLPCFRPAKPVEAPVLTCYERRDR